MINKLNDLIASRLNEYFHTGNFIEVSGLEGFINDKGTYNINIHLDDNIIYLYCYNDYDFDKGQPVEKYCGEYLIRIDEFENTNALLKEIDRAVNNFFYE